MTDYVNATVIILSLVVVGAILNSLATNITTLTSVTNENLDLGTGSVNGTTKTLASHPLDGTALTLIANGVTAVQGTNYTYTLSDGVITFASSAVSGNLTKTSRYWNATYQYQPAGYMTTGIDRTILPYVVTIFLLGIFGAVGYAYLKK